MEKIKYKGQVYVRLDVDKTEIVMLKDLARVYIESAKKVQVAYSKSKSARVPGDTRDRVMDAAEELRKCGNEILRLAAKREEELKAHEEKKK